MTKVTVLVVEDEELLLQAVTQKLELSGFSSIPCKNAEQAIKYLHGAEKPDIIWLDYYLKGIDGLRFMQIIKANDAWKNIPVIVVSNFASQEKVQQMFGLGVKQFLLKTEYKLEEIIAIVKELVEERRDNEQNPNN